MLAALEIDLEVAQLLPGLGALHLELRDHAHVLGEAHDGDAVLRREPFQEAERGVLGALEGLAAHGAARVDREHRRDTPTRRFERDDLDIGGIDAVVVLPDLE